MSVDTAARLEAAQSRSRCGLIGVPNSRSGQLGDPVIDSVRVAHDTVLPQPQPGRFAACGNSGRTSDEVALEPGQQHFGQVEGNRLTGLGLRRGDGEEPIVLRPDQMTAEFQAP